jgi:WG containing repeat
MRNIRHFLILFCCFAATTCFAQTALIPYRVGDKWGLSDEKGTLVVPTTYDYMRYLEGHYFECANRKTPTDTSANARRRAAPNARESYTKGLFRENQLLIAPQEFPNFLIREHFIIASENPYRPENCVLYNLKGEKIIAETMNTLYINDKRDVGQLGRVSQRYTLLSIIFRQKRRAEKTTSIAIFDNETQQIDSYLLDKVSDFKVEKNQQYRIPVLCTYSDSTGFHEQYMCFKDNRFQLLDKSKFAEVETRPESLVRADEAKVESIEIKTSKDWDNVAVPDAPQALPFGEREKMRNAQRAAANAYYQIRQDSLFYVIAEQAKWVKMPKDARLIYKNLAERIQPEGIIYKSKNRFGFVRKGVAEESRYDSLLYFGQNYIVCQQIKQQWKCGVMDKDGKMTIPMVYDSIQGELKYIQFDDRGNPLNEKRRFWVIKEKRDYSPPTPQNPYSRKAANPMLVYQNGKAGMVSKDNDIVIPIQYDTIVGNGFQFSQPQLTDFILLKNNGRYGLTRLEYVSATKKYAPRNTVEPIFKYLPCTYRTDFYDQQGFLLYELYDEDARINGFARADGFLYFKD